MQNNIFAYSANPAFKKDRGVSLIDGWMVDVVENMALSELFASNSSQTYQRYNWVATFLNQHLNIIVIVDNIDGVETKFKIFCIS